MRKNSILAVSAITVAFLLLAAIAAFITVDYFTFRVLPDSSDLETDFRFLYEEDIHRMEAESAVSAVSEPAAEAAASGEAGSAKAAAQKTDSKKEASKEEASEKESSKKKSSNKKSSKKKSSKEEASPETDPKSADLPPEVLASGSASGPAASAAASISGPSETSVEKDHQIIWIGDSRTVSMGKTVKDDCIFIGADGEGYDWQAATGDALLKEAMGKYPKAPVVFGFGVNDYDNMDLYLKYYKDLEASYPDTEFWYLSINPIDPARCQVITNLQIADFNEHLKEAFPDHYLNTFTWLMANEAITVDGIHYDEETNKALHDEVVGVLKGTAVLY